MIDASPDTLTIRQAFERYYEKDELSRNTINGFRHHIACWERLSGDPDVRSIDNATLARFRTAMLEAGYSPSSVNTVWKNLRAILRRTGASLIEQVAPGLGPEFLQHAPRSVSDVSYLNRFDALRAALEKMPVPAGWRAGPKVAARREAEARQQRVEMRQADFVVATGPVPTDWRFRTGAFAYRGRWFPMPSASRLAMLRELVNSTEPVPWTQLADVIRKTDPGSKMANAGNVAAVVANLRGRLRQALCLSDQVDPLPCVQHRPSAWWLWIAEERP